MKKLTTATIATLSLVGVGYMASNDAQAAELNETSHYTTTYSEATQDFVTTDANGNKHHTLDGNWDPSMFNNQDYVFYTENGDGTVDYYYYQTQQTATPIATEAPTDNQGTVTTSGRSIATTASGSNLYTSGQCTYYAFERAGGKIGSTWGNANNWANAARSAGYTVNNKPTAGAIMQTSAGAYGHVAYVESVGSNGSVTVSEMNYGHGAGVVTSRTISASQAAGYNFIH
ncbi:CHAP domain-containing protein [Staphylococcus schleiferi]|uniref:CHAP domain-containing protein n=1 Tax=Staphylococcus schleiferi TaxID=1295 RepID=UPI00247FC1EA|nr:CHAP domain-containing protein [Staphylococcus schleiferi]